MRERHHPRPVKGPAFGGRLLDADRAQSLAETLHRGQRDAGGAPLIDHVRRVAMAVPREARVVAWLHELFEHTSMSEEALLREGLTTDELRALRFLTRHTDSRATTMYLAHIELLATARGPGARVAQTVKRADLTDRARHPSIRPDGWSPPYELGLELLDRAASAAGTRSALVREIRTPTPVAIDAAGSAAPDARARAGDAGQAADRRAMRPVTTSAETGPPITEGEVRAQRLGFALRGLAADLVSERQKVAALRRDVAALRSQLESAHATAGRDQAHPTEPIEARPPWAHWNGETARRYTLGVEEELMLLEPRSGSLAQSRDHVLAQLSDDLSLHASPGTHAAVIELRTDIHATVAAAVDELVGRRRQLAHALDAVGLSVAAAGTHPLTVPQETLVSSAARNHVPGDSLRSLARREPTMALRVHVGVPDAEDAMRVLNGLRRSVPLLLALSANSPFTQGRDGGYDSMRTVILQAFPRTGLPCPFAHYADYVKALAPVIDAGAVTGPECFSWDVRPEPRLGTVEVRVMDAQSTLADVTALVALVQSLSRLALEGDSPQPAPRDEILAENRFLTARDGMAARLIDPASGRLIPVRTMLDRALAECRPHALALGCASELEQVRLLAAAGGARRQRALTAANGGLNDLVPRLANLFLPSERDHGSVAVMSAATAYKTTETDG